MEAALNKALSPRLAVKNIGLTVLFVLSLSGCASAPSIPADYWGPQSKIEDSYTVHSKTEADFFYLDKIDGQKIDDSTQATNSNSRGHGSAMTPVTIERNVPARKATFQIIGRTHYVALIDRMFRTMYQVKGEIEFTPLPNHTYSVKGHIFDNGPDFDNYLAVWIADDENGELVAPKIVLEGASSMGFFEKLAIN